MEIILTSVEPELAAAWRRFCGGTSGITIYEGSILEVECDAVVSPANSFGFMDGGIDHIYSRYFGWHVQERLQTIIREQHYGELLVGTAEIVSTDHSHIPYLIAAPTMRVPMVLKDSINPYLAARATLLLIKYGSFSHGTLKGQPIAEIVKRVALPGLGTGVGQVGSNTCASQVNQAIREVILGHHEFPKTWWEASQHHQKLYNGTIRDLQRD